jgi:hypothetical protein
MIEIVCYKYNYVLKVLSLRNANIILIINVEKTFFSCKSCRLQEELKLNVPITIYLKLAK